MRASGEVHSRGAVAVPCPADTPHKLTGQPARPTEGKDQAEAVRAILRYVTEQLQRPPGHVFISYVREDSARVDRLEQELKNAGIKVWRDKNDIGFGTDWRMEIKNAISEGAFAFLACFSNNSEARETSVQRDELILAAEQMRLRPLGKTWLIPMRFDDCEIPEYPIGADRTFRSLNWTDLFDGEWPNLGRLLVQLGDLLGGSRTAGNTSTPSLETPATTRGSSLTLPSPGRLKSILLDPEREIEVEDLIGESLRVAKAQLSDEATFSVIRSVEKSAKAYVVELLDQMIAYKAVMAPIIEIHLVAGAYAKPRHDTLWERTGKSLAGHAERALGGNTAALNLRHLPTAWIVYSTALGCTLRNNWTPLRALAAAKIPTINNRLEPVLAAGTPWSVFDGNLELASIAIEDARARAQGVDRVTETRINRYAGPSDFLSESLEAEAVDVLRLDSNEYTELFDRAEVMVSLLAEHNSIRAEANGSYLPGSWVGSWVWRNRHSRATSPAELIVEELSSQGPNWPPLKAGLFEGQLAAAQEAAGKFIEKARERQSHIL